jgi:two-component sensor histidine kinase/CheY-like chemotaxis protein
MLSLVQAIARQTAAGKGDDFVERFQERIVALAAGQDLLVKSLWKGVSLEDLVRSQLAHFKDLLDSRITVSGPPLTVTPQASQTLGMALHELSTNASKYGALSNGRGRVTIAWHLRQNAAGKPQLAISWLEEGGPAVPRPARQGFGSAVIKDMTKMSLNADVTLDYPPTGLVWRLDCPMDNVAETHPPGVAATLVPAGEDHHSAAGGQSIARGGRILVVEDEALVALEIASILSSAGFDVIGPAGSVAQALTILDASMCDAVVLDVNLGRETAEPIAVRLLSCGTPFVVVSGYARNQQPAAFTDAVLLNKPVSPERLIAEVRRCLAEV